MTLVLRDIRSVVEACRDGSARCKVILETSLLTNEEKVRACELAVKARADFVKTSTGFSTGGATVEDVALMSRIVRDKGARGESLRRHPLPGRSAPHGAGRRHAHRHQQRHQDSAGSRRPGRHVRSGAKY